jgi:hypothetical protein
VVPRGASDNETGCYQQKCKSALHPASVSVSNHGILSARSVTSPHAGTSTEPSTFCLGFSLVSLSQIRVGPGAAHASRLRHRCDHAIPGLRTVMPLPA